jgi:hypothetical protein
MFVVALMVSFGTTLAWAGAVVDADEDRKMSSEVESRLRDVDARLKSLESRDGWPNVVSIVAVVVPAAVFFIWRSQNEKKARQVEAWEKTKQVQAEASVSTATLLTKVLATSLQAQAPKSLEEAVAKASGDLKTLEAKVPGLEAELKATAGKVETVIKLMTGQP